MSDLLMGDTREAGPGTDSGPSLAELTDLQGHLIDPPLLAPPNPVPPKRSTRKAVRGRIAGPGTDGGDRT